MDEILGYSLAILVGISLGLIGSGGSILTVPILVYVFGIDPILAITYSLFIIGITASVGGVKNIISNNIDIDSSLFFGVPSIISIFITRKFLFPLLPDAIFHLGSLEFSKSLFLMLLFAIFMLIASLNMIFSNSIKEEVITGNSSKWKLILSGVSVGFISGIIGIGGGFLIIPALVYLAKIDMKKAVGTSLLIIASNALIGFLGSCHPEFHLNYGFLTYFSIASISGMFMGIYLSNKIDGSKLKSGFGWFVLIMGIYIIMKELLVK